MGKRNATKYPGVFYLKTKKDLTFYILFTKNGKKFEEKTGRKSQGMTPLQANKLRVLKITGDLPTNKEQRMEKKAKKDLTKVDQTIESIWVRYIFEKSDYSSLKNDEYNCQKHLKNTFANKQPAEISKNEILTFTRKLSKHYKPQTVKHILALLQRIFKYGSNERLCPPLSFKIKMPRVDNVKDDSLNNDQLERLLEVLVRDDFMGTPAANIMKLVLYTGMRKGEVLKLKWKNIDYESKFLNIIAHKGGKDQRIPINDLAFELLSNLTKNCSPYVFPGKNSEGRLSIRKPLNRIKKLADLPDDFRPLHGLRHTFASLLASSGIVDLYTLQKLLTHKST